MTSRMKKGLKEIWPNTGTLLKKAKPIYKDLLKKVEGVSDQNPMSANITMSFVIIAIWLASDPNITPAQMSRVMETALDWKPIKVFFGTIDMNTERGIKRFGNMMKKDAAWPDSDHDRSQAFHGYRRRPDHCFEFRPCGRAGYA